MDIAFQPSSNKVAWSMWLMLSLILISSFTLSTEARQLSTVKPPEEDGKKMETLHEKEPKVETGDMKFLPPFDPANIPGIPFPQFPFPPPFDIPNLPPLPNFPLPPFRFPPNPFFQPPPA